MKKITAKLAIFLFLLGLLAAGVSSCSDYGNYGDDYGDPYGGASSQLP